MKIPCFLSLALSSLAGLCALAASAHGDAIYSADVDSENVEQFTIPSGTASVFVNTTPIDEPGPVNANPEGLAFDKSGNLYVADYTASTIEEYSAAGADLGHFVQNSGLDHPNGLVFDTSGNLYTANYVAGNVQVITPAGGSSTTFVNTDATTGVTGSKPTDVAFDKLGNLYVACSTTNTIQEYNFLGASLGSFTTSLQATNTTNTLNKPNGLAFDSSGNLYVANFGSSTVEEYNALGHDLGAVLTASAGLNGPESLTFDSSGNLYVANANTSKINNVTGNAILEYSASGVSSTFAFIPGTGPGNKIYADPAALAFEASPIPEPSTCSLLAASGLGFLAVYRRQRARCS